MLTNILRFFKALFSSAEVRWTNLSIYISKDSYVSDKARIYGPAKLVNVTIDKGTYIAANAVITDTSIGKFCSVGPNLLCGWGIHPLNGVSTSPAFYSTKEQAGFTYAAKDKINERKPITIGNDVFIGANVVILDGVEVGDGAVIGAGSIVSKNIPPYAIVAGNPIQIIRYRFPDHIIDQLQKSEWWNGTEEDLKKVEENFFSPEDFLNSLDEQYARKAS